MLLMLLRHTTAEKFINPYLPNIEINIKPFLKNLTFLASLVARDSLLYTFVAIPANENLKLYLFALTSYRSFRLAALVPSL